MKTCQKMQQVVTRLAEKFGLDLTAAAAHRRLKRPGYDPLVIEKLGPHLVSVAHYDEQPDDPVADPEMVFWLGLGAWVPIEISQVIGGRRQYAEIAADAANGVRMYDLAGQRELAEIATAFARHLEPPGWLKPTTHSESLDGAMAEAGADQVWTKAVL